MTVTRIANIFTIFTVVAFVLWVLCLIAFGREGDDHGNHGPLKEWFNQLSSKKGLCCSFADGVSVSDVDWDTQDGHYRVFMCFMMPQTSHSSDKLVQCSDKKWEVVPDDAVITEPNRFGPAVVWPVYQNDGTIGIRCFMPGAGT